MSTRTRILPLGTELVFHIEELILEGLDQVDRHWICEEVQRELAILLQDQALEKRFVEFANIENVSVGDYDLCLGPGTKLVGMRIACSVYKAVCK